MVKKEPEQELLHVGIKDPGKIQRDILELSKGVIESLKNYERLNATREEKTEEMARLRGELKSISKLVGKLKSELPKIKFKPVKKKQGIKDKPDVKKEKPAPRKPVSELEKLEKELSEIEGKLDSIE